MKDKWKTSENVVKTEISSIAQLYDVCKNIRTCQFEYGKKQVEESNIPKNENLIYIPAENKKNKIPNIQHFGGKAPFSKDDDPFENYKKDDIEMKYEEIRVNRKEIKPKEEDIVDYVYRKPEKVNNIVEKKDPMVWDPPEEKIEKKSKII